MKRPSQILSVTQRNTNDYDTIKLYYWLGVNKNFIILPPVILRELYFFPDKYIPPPIAQDHASSDLTPTHKAKKNNLAWL